MPHPNAINPETGKRFNFVEPQSAREAQRLQREHLRTIARDIKVAESRDRLLTFTKFTSPHPEDPSDVERSSYDDAKFHRIVARHLEEVERGDIRQLIFCMPPRHGKSELATRRLAAWYSGRHPEHDVIVAAASDNLAMDFGADVRAIMATKQFRQVFPAHSLRRGGAAKDNIQTTKGGRLIFAGRGGTINGRGAHLLLVDDLYKDDQEAASPTIRDHAWNWLNRVALFRRMGKKLTILTMTRWHSDDVIGRLTDPENDHYNQQEAESWKIIRLPGLAEDDDPLGRKEGEPLWPQRYDKDYFLSAQRRDPLGFAALIQQRPTVADGIMFKRENIRRYRPDQLPTELRYYAASDHAVGTTQRNDPSCFGKAGIDKNDDLYFTDLYWNRAPSDAAVEAMLAMGGGKNPPIQWWAERGHISKSIGPFLRKRMLETGTYINLIEVTPVTDKVTRAQSIAARVAMGKVFFPEGAVWDKAIDEMLAFPNGLHDDFVDMIAYFGLGLGSQFGARTPAPRREAAPVFGTLGWVKEADRWREHERKRLSAGGF